ncbi:ABC transporter substrate-binding protein [Cytobacillus purgationiresistens]|uniref:Spermidine/putrescine transport system substrate-binding protein n=1 Tax=Cytobacillus purgationiresistens TaxID=863449 RepID=A0ABU0AKF0_9BACI|nr:ABC transporter substrate-binding protein [Cytobacillus purgationiresistens]MDQ0271727.1 putative spermidine/putrescine transport system substrate-binding protein [Cytobacillus purgationiresistens]
MKKIHVYLILFTAVLIVLSGCGKPIQPNNEASGAKTDVKNDEISIAIFGGDWGGAIKKHIIQPFEQETGIKVNIIEGNSTTTFSRLLQEKSSPTIDIALMDSGISELSNDESVVETIDKSKLKENNSLLPEAFNGSEEKAYGVALGYWGLGIVYNKDVIKNPPQSWKDFWNDEYKGKLTVPTPATTGGLPLLMKISEIEGNAKGAVDKGLDKMKELDVVAYFDGSGAATNLYQSGEASVGAHYGGPTYVMKEQGLPLEFVIPEEGVLGAGSFWHVVKGTEKVEQVYSFLNYATSKSAQEGIANDLYLAPIHKDVDLDEKILERMPFGKDGSIQDLNMPDYNLINEHREEWNNLWNREIIGG